MTPRFRTLLLEALAHFRDGYTSEADLQDWLLKLRYALEQELPTDEATRKEIAGILGTIFARDVSRGGLQKRVPGVSRYTLDRIAPSLRAELDRRIFASADLIRLNKQAAVEKTLQRFSGWVSSVPPSGTKEPVREVAGEILKPSKQLKFERRRVAIDQGHKLSSAIAHVVAMGSGAIACVWHDRAQWDKGYDARPEHLKRTGTVFLVKDSWAVEQGLVKRGSLPYYDDLPDQAATLPFCSCFVTWVTTPRDLPPEVLTARGRAWVEGRSTLEAVRHDATPAQIAAGNYPKGHVRIAGLDITIETPKHALRRGVGADGKPWSVVMPADYGYIKRTKGADGEQLDCYVGPNQDARAVWVIHQIDLSTRLFDEHKAMIGFDSRAEALQAYEAGFSDGMGLARLGLVDEMPVADFKRWALQSEPPRAVVERSLLAPADTAR